LPVVVVATSAGVTPAVQGLKQALTGGVAVRDGLVGVKQTDGLGPGIEKP
jgi:hypothetical protein